MVLDSESVLIAGRRFKSRLIVGTGKYKDGPETRAIDKSDCHQRWPMETSTEAP